MFLRKAALRPVPKYAVVDDNAVESLERSLGADQEDLQQMLDTGYRDLDRKQPAISAYLAEEVSNLGDELAQSLGYFLAVTVFLAFQEAFPTRLGSVDPDALRIALDTLETDEELRANDPLEVLESDDVIAMGQPALVEYVQHHMREALEQAGDGANMDDLDVTYRAILVEVIALSHAVTSPTGEIVLA